MLDFCQSCNNLYIYVHDPDTKELLLKCQSCGRQEPAKEQGCIYFNKFVQSSYDIKIDQDLCHDPTLPHTNQIKCRNVECKSNLEPDEYQPDIVFFHYNEDKKLAYICCLCKTYWKN